MSKFKIFRFATAYVQYEKIIEANDDEFAMEIADLEMENVNNWSIYEITDYHDYECEEVNE
jgi:hypothetical protein